MNGKRIDPKELKIAKCEDCGGEVVFITWPAGWTQCGGSKYGAEYQSQGMAWHCPRHRGEDEAVEGDKGGKA